MLPGPVFNVELVITARRARYYVVRVIYGLILLVLVWINYVEATMFNRSGGGRGAMSRQEMAQFADRVFATFAVVQGVMVLLLTPTLVAGVIVDEKQRKTLHYLLASRLSSGEIVLGKLAARLLHLGVFLGVGLPIMSLLSLFGGVDPRLVFLAYCGTLSLAFFLAGLSIWVSTISKKIREAVTLVYMLEMAWLVIPPLIEGFVSVNAPGIHPWVKMVNDWLLDSLPYGALGGLSSRGGGTSLTPFLWMIGLQVGYGSLFVLLSVWRLRPIFRAQDGATSRVSRLGARMRRWHFRVVPRPRCGNYPMLWKELFVSRTSGLVKLVGTLVGLVLGGFLVYGVLFFGSGAFDELVHNGYFLTDSYSERGNFNGFLRAVCTGLYCIWILGVACAAAGGVTSEREQDTWLSLVATPLDGAEILSAKMIGAVWTARVIGVLMLVLWVLGLLLGAIHPLGLIAILIEVTVFTWFATSLGTYLSLRSKSTLRAQATAIGILLFLNGGYLMCCIPFRVDTAIIAFACTPFLQAVAPLSYEDVRGVFDPTSVGYNARTYNSSAEIFMASVLGVIGYAGAAFGLMQAALGGFAKAVDRPTYPSELPIEPKLLKRPAGGFGELPDEDVSTE
jgi:ABC-type transport system involved in multi-copper enzyme maturation permease subunit